jgi:hypothetical protein
MANPANMMKMLQALGGMGSESYGAPTQGGQPILPKPIISGPGVMSPYAPMNNPAGEQMPQGSGLKPSKMGEADHHPANQLAQYLTLNGRSARRQYTDAGDHARGAISASGVVPGARGY